MGTKLIHNVKFSAVIVDGTRISPNNYNVKLNLITTTDNRTDQNIALQRILFMIREVFNESIFVAEKNPIAKKLFRLAKDSHIIEFPEDPFDQIVGMVLYDKIDAIVEGNLEIDNLVIGSNLAKDLFYVVDEYQKFEHDQTKIEFSWWDRPDTTTTDNLKAIKNACTWKDINLIWDRDQNKEVEFVLDLEYNEKEPDVIVLEGGTENE